MAQITNAELKHDIEGLRSRMDTMELRMKNYETKADANHLILQRVDAAISAILLIGKWLLGILSGVVVLVLGYWLLSLLHIVH